MGGTQAFQKDYESYSGKDKSPKGCYTFTSTLNKSTQTQPLDESYSHVLRNAYSVGESVGASFEQIQPVKNVSYNQNGALTTF